VAVLSSAANEEEKKYWRRSKINPTRRAVRITGVLGVPKLVTD
jgi:hypothetical protein